jgi:pimeloyl-ACP methyl ester carboxylesterase
MPLDNPVTVKPSRGHTLKYYWIASAALLLALAAYWLWTPDRSQAYLAERYLRSPQDLVTVDGVQLHVRDDGPKDSPAIVLLHGFGASLHTWEPWAQALSKDFRVIRFDAPGSGLSAPDPTGDYTDARSLQLLGDLMTQLGIDRATLVGNSMGGRIAWSFAAAQPQRVDKLVLISPDGFASPGFEYGKAPEVPAMLQLMRVVLPRAVLRMNLKPAYVDPQTLTDPLLDQYHDLLRAPGAREAMLQRMRQMVLTDPVPRLKTIQAPTLLLWGEQDAMIPLSNAQDYLQAITGSRLVTLPGVGHLPQEEAPDRALEAVRAFLVN